VTSQLELFPSDREKARLETEIVRKGNTLVVPEGAHTIPCTHGMHKFAGKFIPNIPRFLMREALPQGDRVIMDPFCGSGTTLVEAALEGRRFIGLDIDPLAVLISTAKTQLLDPTELLDLADFWRGHDYTSVYPELVPSVPNLDHWFTERAVLELSSVKHGCLVLPPRLRVFSLVVFSSIIRRVSNADDQTQKTYVSHTLPKSPPIPSVLFPLFLQRAIEGMREYRRLLPRPPCGSICRGDAVLDVGRSCFDDVITSPPYIDSIDYVYNQMLEYFWLLDELGIGSYDTYRLMRKLPMGFRTYSESEAADALKEYLPSGWVELDHLLSQIGEHSKRERSSVLSFFLDYARHVERTRERQRTDGIYISVAGNSVIRGATVPTCALIEEIHRSTGYVLVDKWSYEIRRHYMKFPRRGNSGKISRDFVMIFRADT